MEGLLARQAAHVGERLRKNGLSGRTVTIKVRLHDFTTLSRSSTLARPTDSGPSIARVARSLLADLDTSGGVGCSAWASPAWRTGSRRTCSVRPSPTSPRRTSRPPSPPGGPYVPGMDVVHEEMGPGWVWGSGKGVVTVRFETAQTPPGPVRSYAVDDPALAPAPRPLED